MSASPFYQEDLPRAERVIAAPIERVFAVVEDVEGWPRWLPRVPGPVRASGPDTYEITTARGESRRVVVTARGPTHTIAFDIEQLGQLAFRTRPNPSGTRVEAIGRPVGHGSWRRWLGSRKRRARAEAWLASVLDDLAKHLDPG